MNKSKPLHAWQNQKHISLGKLTSEQWKEIAQIPEPEPEPDFESQVIERLLDFGWPTQKVEEALPVINELHETHANLRAYTRAAQVVHHFFRCVDGNTTMAAVRRAYFNSRGESLRKAAAMEGVSKTTLDRQAKRLKKLPPLVQNGTASHDDACPSDSKSGTPAR